MRAVAQSSSGKNRSASPRLAPPVLALLAVAVQSVGVFDPLKRYRQLEGRVRHEGRDSPEEDAILDEMDDVWWKLEESERQLLNDEGPDREPVDGGS